MSSKTRQLAVFFVALAVILVVFGAADSSASARPAVQATTAPTAAATAAATVAATSQVTATPPPKASITAGTLMISGAYIRPVIVKDDHRDAQMGTPVATAMMGGMGDMNMGTPPAMPATPAMSGMGGMGDMNMGTPPATPAMSGMGGMNMGDMGGPTSAAYMVIANSGSADDRLMSVTADPSVAGAVEIHETKVVNDVASMQQITGGLVVPAGGQVELRPGSYHIMILGVKHTLAVGDLVRLTLTFQSGATITLDVPVLNG